MLSAQAKFLLNYIVIELELAMTNQKNFFLYFSKNMTCMNILCNNFEEGGKFIGEDN